jgi:paraquat-inducible protein A
MNYQACPECDLLFKPINLKPGQKAFCPRCHFLLVSAQKNSIEKILAMSLAGLILIAPANFLPLIAINLFGNQVDGTLWTGVISLFHQDMWLVAILVFIASIFLPLANTLLAFLLSYHLHYKKYHRALSRWLRWFQHLSEWAMLEVYALSIIVACVKLSSMADIQMGLGLYAFIALLVTNALMLSTINYQTFWQKIAMMKGIES